MTGYARKCQEMAGFFSSSHFNTTISRPPILKFSLKKLKGKSRVVIGCYRILKYVHRCQNMSTDVNICMSTNVSRCQEMSRFIKETSDLDTLAGD
jgi:hypothetical protein